MLNIVAKMLQSLQIHMCIHSHPIMNLMERHEIILLCGWIQWPQSILNDIQALGIYVVTCLYILDIYLDVNNLLVLYFSLVVHIHMTILE